MANRQAKWIKITDLQLKDASLFFNFQDFTGRHFSTELRYSESIEETLRSYPAQSVYRLANYLGIAHCLYCFNYDYYDEIIAYFRLDDTEQAFFEQLLLAGMAEFRYVNHLNIHQKTYVQGVHELPGTHDDRGKCPSLAGAIVLNGGGKDGAVAAETTHAIGEAFTWFTITNRSASTKVVAASAVNDALTVQRIHTRPEKPGTLKGHKPFSAVLGFHVTLAALIGHRRYAIAGNEYSANEPSLAVDDFIINHQYSKSYQFERDLANLIDRLGVGVSYFSILRPLYELQILKIFEDFPQYHREFISCNIGVLNGFWCLTCDKCAFLVLALSALNPDVVEKIWGDRQLVIKSELRRSIIALVSPDTPKPFECVGTLEECQLALGMMARNRTFWSTLPSEFRQEVQAYIPPDLSVLEKRIMGTVDRPEHIPEDLRRGVLAFFKQHLKTN